MLTDRERKLGDYVDMLTGMPDGIRGAAQAINYCMEAECETGTLDYAFYCMLYDTLLAYDDKLDKVYNGILDIMAESRNAESETDSESAADAEGSAAAIEPHEDA